MEWSCPNCGTKNPGLVKTCRACGNPQPENVQFEQAQAADLLKDEQKIAAAQAGADVHCPYCGTRNPATATQCSQCGGDLMDGAKRTSGQVLGAFGTPGAPVPTLKCPSCGVDNPGVRANCQSCGAMLRQPAAKPAPSAKNPSGAATKATGQKNPVGVFRPWMALPIIGFLLMCCLVIGIVFLRTETVTGTVSKLAWQRSVEIEARRDVNRSDWRDEIPSDGKVKSCSEKLYDTVSDPVAGAKEVCGTPYTVDTGSGAGKVVQDCQYEIYKDYCEYTVKDWTVVDTAVARGADLNPFWPQFQLNSGEREGSRQESYTVYFETTDGVKEYSVDDPVTFAMFEPDSQWSLQVNALGGVNSVAPLVP